MTGNWIRENLTRPRPEIVDMVLGWDTENSMRNVAHTHDASCVQCKRPLKEECLSWLVRKWPAKFNAYTQYGIMVSDEFSMLDRIYNLWQELCSFRELATSNPAELAMIAFGGSDDPTRQLATVALKERRELADGTWPDLSQSVI